MKFFLYIFSLASFFISCKNEDKEQKTDSSPNLEQRDNPAETSESPRESENRAKNPENTTPDIDEGMNPDRETSQTPNETASKVQTGRYIKEGENDANCSCYCVEITSEETELCLRDKDIYIDARITGNNGRKQLFYTKPSAKNTNKDLPWEDFDTHTPIAEITLTENGGMELDWKGFTINGELSVDHAILGKKTLEGKYRKQ